MNHEHRLAWQNLVLAVWRAGDGLSADLSAKALAAARADKSGSYAQYSTTNLADGDSPRILLIIACLKTNN